jgi:hypothetical protein
MVFSPIAYLLCARRGVSALIAIGWFLLLLLCLFAASGVSTLLSFSVASALTGGTVTWSMK